jgi:serine/threonine protein kinase
VALKRVYITFNSSETRANVQRTLEREALILANVHHPNVVRFFGVCIMGDAFMIVTEECDG